MTQTLPDCWVEHGAHAPSNGQGPQSPQQGLRPNASLRQMGQARGWDFPRPSRPTKQLPPASPPRCGGSGFHWPEQQARDMGPNKLGNHRECVQGDRVWPPPQAGLQQQSAHQHHLQALCQLGHTPTPPHNLTTVP